MNTVPKFPAEKVAGTQLLDRAIAILTYLGETGVEGAKASELADAIGLKQSTAHRIISALERHGLIEREEKTRRFRLGLSLFVLGAKAADGTGFRRVCHASLLRIAAETGDTVFLMARSGFNTVCVDRQEGTYVIYSLTGQVGGQIPLGVGSASQAILAYMREDEAEVVLQTNGALYGDYNGLTVEEIAGNLAIIREQGYAFDHGRLVEGISAIAVPILPQGRDVVGAIAVNMTSARLQPDRLDELVDLLRAEVGRIEATINPLEPVI